MVPQFQNFFSPILKTLEENETLKRKDIIRAALQRMNLSEEDLNEEVPSGTQKTAENRAAWSISYLNHTPLIKKVSRGMYQITDEGREFLRSNSDSITLKDLLQFEEFREFHSGKKDNTEKSTDTKDEKSSGSETPDELLNESYLNIRKSLAYDILDEVLSLKGFMFERMVLDLLHKMGYGAYDDSLQTTPASYDQGIDGIILEDKLGFNLIYVQMKRYNTDHLVGSADMRNFVGAIARKDGKGLFVTSSGFTNQARKIAEENNIRLIDGEKLVNYMIDYDFGVSPKKVYKIKEIDTDFFVNYSDES